MVVLRNIAFNIITESLISNTNSQLLFQCFVSSSIDLSPYILFIVHDGITHTCWDWEWVVCFLWSLFFFYFFHLVLAFDFFYLSFQWPVSFCNADSSSHCSNIPPYFTMHGLRPQLINGLPVNRGTPSFNSIVVYIYIVHMI